MGRVMACVLAAVGSCAYAADTPLTQLRFSTDVTLLLGGGPFAVNSNAVVADDLSAAPGQVTGISFGTLPAGVRVLAYHQGANGDHLFVLDTTVTLGAVTATPRTVVAYAPADRAYSVFFDGAAHGIPDGTMIDALALIDDTDLLLSFDVPTLLPGNVFADPRDLVRYGAVSGAYSLHFDGSAAGLAPGLNVQDVHFFDHNAHLLLNFDGAGIVGGVGFDADSVVELTPPSTWHVVYDGSMRDSRWTATGSEADLVALYAQTLRKVLDVDGDGNVDALTDGLLATRFLLGVNGPALINAALASGAQRFTPETVQTYLTSVMPFLDADGNGNVDPMTDGVLMLRYLFGVRGASLSAGGAIGAGSPRTTAQVETYISGLSK